MSHLAVRDGVVVDAHLRVDVFKIPSKAATLQLLPQGQTLGDVAEIHAGVLSTNSETGERRLARGCSSFKRRQQTNTGVGGGEGGVGAGRGCSIRKRCSLAAR